MFKKYQLAIAAVVLLAIIGLAGSAEAANKKNPNKVAPVLTTKVKNDAKNKSAKQSTITGIVKSQTDKQMVVTVEKKSKNKVVSTTDITVVFPVATQKTEKALNKKISSKANSNNPTTSKVGYFNRKISVGDEVRVSGKKQKDGTIIGIPVEKTKVFKRIKND